MPASSFNLYNMQYARNNFDAMRPAPICPDANHIMGHCQNIHISTNCYHGFHQPKHQGEIVVSNDCEMQEVPVKQKTSTSRKRCADETDYPQLKRHREEVQREKSIIKTETEKNKKIDSEDDILESLYWNIHGGNDPSMCSLVGTRSSPSHSASAYTHKYSYLILRFKFVLNAT